MLQDLFGVTLRSKSHCPVFFQQMLNKVNQLVWEVNLVGGAIREHNFCVKDFGRQHLLITIEEGGNSEHQFDN